MVDSIFRSRLTSEHWGNTTDYFMYTYDAVGNLLYATDGQHAYSYAYDALNRPIYTTFNFDSQSAVFAYTYDLAGRRTSSSLSLNGHSDRVNQVTYDFLGNATKIIQTGSAVDDIFAEFDYNANGLMTSVKRYEVDGNNLINEIAESLYTYNANNAVTSITHKNPSGTQIAQHSYTYDETNNIVEYLNSIDGQTSYDYDFLGQLIGADYANQNLDDETYTYDENGNRVTANGNTCTTGTNNELTSDGDFTYTYDAEGNRISKTNAANTERELYTWDYRNRLTTVTKQTCDTLTNEWTTVQIVEYSYDYNNVWIRKTVGNNSTIFIPENYQTTVLIDNNAVAHHYLWTPNQQDKLLADTTSTEVLWSLTDHLGTIRDVLGATTTHLIYDAFGNLTSGTNPLLFGYTGKPFDPATQLQNNINRWYDATIGRWLSTDPIGFNGKDMNLYRYINHKMIISFDTLGLQEWQIPNTDKMQPGKCYYQICKTPVANGAGTHSFILLYDNAEMKWHEFRGGPSESSYGSISASDRNGNQKGAILWGESGVFGESGCEHPSQSGKIPECTLFEIPNCNGDTKKINFCFQVVIQKINSLGVLYKPVPGGVANLNPNKLYGNCNTLTSILQDVCLGEDKTVWKRPGITQPGDKELTLYYQKLIAAIKKGFPQALLPPK